jgi:excisionase family DNA binding protein
MKTQENTAQEAPCGIQTTPPGQRTYREEAIASMLGIGRSSAYTLVQEGHFRIVRIGTSIRISKKSFDEWLGTVNKKNTRFERSIYRLL